MSKQKNWDVLTWDTDKGKVKVYLFDNNKETRDLLLQMAPPTMTKYQISIKAAKEKVNPTQNESV